MTLQPAAKSSGENGRRATLFRRPKCLPKSNKPILTLIGLFLIVSFQFRVVQVDSNSDQKQQQPQPSVRPAKLVPAPLPQADPDTTTRSGRERASGNKFAASGQKPQEKIKAPPDKKQLDDKQESEDSRKREIINNLTKKLSNHLKYEFQRYDGWYNNLANPDWGSPNSRLRRKVAPAYSDGVYQMYSEDDPENKLPSARLLSQRMMRGDDGLASRRNLTTIFAFFGQVIASEILMASESGCPIEMHRIKIEKCDPMYDRNCRGGRTMPFYRAVYDPQTGQSPNLPREQLNKVTSWIDGSFVYSTSETWLNTMRSFDGKGTLKMVASPHSSSATIKQTELNLDTLLMDPLAVGSALASSLASSISITKESANGAQQQQQQAKSPEAEQATRLLQDAPMSLFGYPMRNKKRAPLINQMPAHYLKMKTAERMFLLGDPRTNQNPAILAFGILFYRWHNVLAERIHAQHPDWSDEEIFQRARRLVIASMQNIFLYEYLPTLLDTPAPVSAKQLKSLIRSERMKLLAFNESSPVSGGTNLTPGAAELGLDLRRNLILYEQLVRSDEESDELDLIKPYTGYKPDLHPGVSHVFQSAAFRFGHTMIPPGLYLRDDKCQFLNTPSGFKGIRLCSTWWNAEEVISKVGIEQLLMGAASQLAEREDSVLCNDVRDKLFGPLDFSRRDLAALNIMRGRDNGLADYNTVRQAFKLAPIERWQDINPKLFEREPKLFLELAELYDNQLDRIDLYIGGMLESDLERGRPGPLFRRIIKEQFERLRDSDRFWFENLESGIFSEREIEEIRQIKLYDIIINSTLIPEHAIQREVFKFKTNDPCPQPGQLSSKQLQSCYIVKGHSYFKGSELTYLIVCLTLVAIPILCSLIAYLVIRYQDKKRRQFKTKQEYLRNQQANKSSSPERPVNGEKQQTEKFYTKEWLHSNLKRKIKVRFGPAPDETLYILDRKCQVQRKLNLKQSSLINVELSIDYAYTSGGQANNHSGSELSLATKSSSLASLVPLRVSGQPGGGNLFAGDRLNFPNQQLSAEQLDEPVNHKPMVLIRVGENYDLVLQFYDVQQRRKFVFKLQAYLQSINKGMSLIRVPRDIMLANAETKERRQQRLEQFFREAYALTFGLNNSGNRQAGSEPQHQASTGASGSSAGGGREFSAAKVSPDIGLVMRTSLSRQEFAEALGMRQDSLFVRQMFNCVDKDGNGRISFQEFLDIVVTFSRGKPDDKLRIVFDMCDHEGKGVIEKAELIRILRSLVDDIAKTKSLTEEGILQMIDEMFRAVGLDQKQMLTYDDFKLIINSHNSGGSATNPAPNTGDAKLQPDDQLNKQHQQQILSIGLDMKGAKKNFFVDTSASMASKQNDLFDGSPASPASSSSASANSMDELPSRYRKMTVVYTGAHQEALNRHLQEHKRRQQKAQLNSFWSNPMKALAWQLNERWKSFITELEEHRQDIVYLFMFYVIVIVLFFERFILYSFLSEHMDLRHVMGFGIAITRGSAASLSFCYALLLLTMCRNIMTWIRTMGVRDYIPLDSHVKFHKIVAMTALLMTILHTIGHCVNFYHVTQQPVEHLRCLTKEMQFSGESRPTFFYWIFQTITGLTGLILWILCSIIYIFAHQKVRQRAYSVFWSTHKLYYLIYAFTLLHGSSKLTGSPRFWIFFIIPAILFTIDKVISLQTKLLQLEIFETECLPSDVIAVKFARPPSFKFLSGQWVRLACTAFRPHEFHAFTLTSAPQDDYLSVHVRAQGPWTWKLRTQFDPANLQYNKLLQSQLPPRIRIEGPFGGGNQDWYKYEVAVMIGGGIGVTPYASILNDLVFGTSTNRYSGVAYKKVYFIWICPSHRNFEWFIDVLRDVESKDVTNVLEMHIFITQFFHKFDLRTTMLYICENHFQRISNRSLFTGLKAINHFGRPDIAALLQHVQDRHSQVNKVGVFSCGPKAMTKSITEACEKVNKRRKLPMFLHQYENFS